MFGWFWNVYNNTVYMPTEKKCLFDQAQLKYLGHIVSAEGVSADPKKLQVMADWPPPKTLRDLRGFLGLTGYYRKFVRGYGLIAQPLTNQLKKDLFGWSTEAQAAFDTLKTTMCTVPVLALPDFSLPFILEADASGSGLGAVLMQNQRPVAFFSQVLTPRARTKSVYEREFMAIVLAVQKWRPYLLGRKFLVRTDQKSLKYLLEQRLVAVEHQKWLTKLLGYDFDIVYKPGLENRAADALSRLHQDISLAVLSVPSLISLPDLQTHVLADPSLAKIVQELSEGRHTGGYSLSHGCLKFKGRMAVPSSSPFIPLILQEYHNTALGGHSGILKTFQRIAQDFHWVGMRRDVQRFVAECAICQQHKYLSQSPAGLLQPLLIPEQV